VGVNFQAERNPVSERTINGIYKKMKSGMSWPNALSSYWGKIRREEDKILLALYNPDLSSEDVKGYQALAKFRNKIII
jgi:DNA invertase Pin-like site-specific DNA recombinase